MKVDYSYPKKKTCGFCPGIKEAGFTDRGRCPIDGKLHDIMEVACGNYGEENNDDRI